MPAVDAVAEIGVLRRASQDGRVVFRLVIGSFVRQAARAFLDVPEPGQHGGDRGASQAIMASLHGGHRRAEWRFLGVEQAPTRERLHDGDAHAVFLAQRVQALALRVHVLKAGLVLVLEQVVDVLGSGQHIVSGVDGEHDHLDVRRNRSPQRNLGVMRGQADMIDAPGGLLSAHELDEGTLHDLLELDDRVHEVDQPQLDMPAEASEQFLPRRDHRVHVARASILTVLPRGAEMALHDPLVAVRADGVAQNPAHRRIGHPAIHDVDALLRSEIHQTGNLLLVVTRHPLRAEADLADLKPRPAQTPVVHGTPSFA